MRFMAKCLIRAKIESYPFGPAIWPALGSRPAIETLWVWPLPPSPQLLTLKPKSLRLFKIFAKVSTVLRLAITRPFSSPAITKKAPVGVPSSDESLSPSSAFEGSDAVCLESFGWFGRAELQRIEQRMVSSRRGSVRCWERKEDIGWVGEFGFAELELFEQKKFNIKFNFAKIRLIILRVVRKSLLLW